MKLPDRTALAPYLAWRAALLATGRCVIDVRTHEGIEQVGAWADGGLCVHRQIRFRGWVVSHHSGYAVLQPIWGLHNRMGRGTALYAMWWLLQRGHWTKGHQEISQCMQMKAVVTEARAWFGR